MAEPSVLDWVQAGTAIVEMIAVVVASGIAGFGITTWKREHLGKRKIEVAEQTLALFYETRSIFNAIRSKAYSTEEALERVKLQGEYQDQTDDLNLMFAVRTRFKQYESHFAKIKATSFQFMAVVGKEHVVLFDRFESLVHSLKFAASELENLYAVNPLARNIENVNDNEFEKKLQKAEWRFHGKLWLEGTPDTRDAIAMEHWKILSAVENVCKGVLGKP